jgi:hypothetical protein
VEGVLEFMCNVITGVVGIHGCGIVHRHNIMIGGEDGARICDFAWSYFVTRATSGGRGGTGAYAQPEMLRSECTNQSEACWLGLPTGELLTGLGPGDALEGCDPITFAREGMLRRLGVQVTKEDLSQLHPEAVVDALRSSPSRRSPC